MKNGDVIVFKVYSDFSMKKLFKMFLDPDKPYFENMIKLRNRLINRRQNVGPIYVVHQQKYGITIERFPRGIPDGGYDPNSKVIDYQELEYIIKIVNRNNPTKGYWFKIRK